MELRRNTLFQDANLDAYYRMESGALTTDSSGNGNTLTNNNTVTAGTGLFGGAANFGSSNTNKSLSRTDSLSYDGGAYSMVGIANITTAPSNDYSTFMRVQDATSLTYIDMAYEDVTGTKTFFVRRFKSGVSLDNYPVSQTFTTGVNYHVGVSYDGSTVRGYINGSEVVDGASSGNGSSGSLDDRTYIGSFLGTSRFLSGLMDDCAFFNRKLESSEFLALYQDAISENALAFRGRNRDTGYKRGRLTIVTP